MMDLNYQFIETLKKLSFVEAIYLYGSRARGDNQPRSDIDIVIVAPAATEKDWTKVMSIIENADTLLKIDCIRFDSLKNDELLKTNFELDKKILYSKQTG